MHVALCMSVTPGSLGKCPGAKTSHCSWESEAHNVNGKRLPRASVDIIQSTKTHTHTHTHTHTRSIERFNVHNGSAGRLVHVQVTTTDSYSNTFNAIHLQLVADNIILRGAARAYD